MVPNKMKKISKDSWNMIQRVIRRYQENKINYENRREELLEGSPFQDGQPKGNLPANRMENAIMSLNDPYMERMRREIEAVEAAYDLLSEDHKKIIRIRFWSDRERNMPYLWMTRCVSYSEVQMKRVCTAFIKAVGKNLGEIKR